MGKYTGLGNFITIHDVTYKNIQSEVAIMATPISYGLVLEGQDARDFEEYQKNPTVTEDGLELVREVLRRQREAEKSGSPLV